MDPHLRIGSSQDLYQCGVWTENFALKDKLGAHIRSTPPNYMNCCRCEVCGKLFSRISDLKTHLWVHTTKEKPFACDICNKTFGSLNSKNSHRRKVHRGELGIGSAGTANSSSASAATHHHSQQQMQVVHSSCHMQQAEMAHSRSPNDTHAHMQASPSSHSHLQQPQHAHSQSQHPHPSSQPHSLQQTSSTAGHRLESHSHSHSHDHDRSHCHNLNEAGANRKHSPPCDVCGKTFAFTNYIKLHQTVHTKEKPFSCDLCPKRFSQPSSRNRHRKKSHKQENCEIGPLSLAPAHHAQSAGTVSNPTTSGASQQHQTKKNSPPCEVCGKTFAFKNYLKAHYRVHSKEKPYVCDLCFRRFTQASSRNFHRKRMHKEASLIEPTPQQMAMQPPVTTNLQSSSSSHDQKPFHCKACVPTYHPSYNKQ